jgi:threonylcarbamoyladenosine tRNA methylthiotransferase MtaB
MRYLVKTLGCKANLYDSQRIEAELQNRGWLPSDGETPPTLCVVNSCTVTDEADRQSRKLAARLSRDNPNAAVVVTGCAAEVDPERIASSKGVHYVIGNRDKPELVELILRKLETHRPGVAGEVLGVAENYSEMISRHPMDRDWPVVGSEWDSSEIHGESARTRAFLKIQEGCNAFCTYCIIPYGRGPSRSLRPREVIAQVRELVEKGIREVVITGTNIGDYGVDWSTDGSFAPQLTALLKQILKETSLERLRVSSLDPTEITDEMLEFMASEPRFCSHFHVSLQSPHSRILKLMKRKYAFEQVESCLTKIAKLPAPVGGVFVGMDVITGFPGESEAEFEWGFEALRALPWTRLHVFPYSERAGTPATRLPNSVPQEARVHRARRLNELGLERMKAVYEKALADCRRGGQALDGILLERVKQGMGGYTSNYLRVVIPGETQGNRGFVISAVPNGVLVDSQNGDVSLTAKIAE